MAVKALNVIAKIADGLEIEWDDKLVTMAQNHRKLEIQVEPSYITNGVYAELKKRYKSAGWELNHDDNGLVRFCYKPQD